MTEIILFHHVLDSPMAPRIRGRTATTRATPCTPDLFGGRTFPTLDDGLTHVRSVGLDVLAQRGVDAASALPSRAVFSTPWTGTRSSSTAATSRPPPRRNASTRTSRSSSTPGSPRAAAMLDTIDGHRS